MNYEHRKKERRFKKILIKIYEIFRFKSLNLPIALKIVLVGTIITSISLFLPWIVDNRQTHTSWNAFNSIGGNIGFGIALPLLLIIFSTISNSLKEKVKLALNIKIHMHTLYIITGIFIITSGMIYVNFVNGLALFINNIIVGKGMILYMVSGVIIIIGGILDRKSHKKREDESFINEQTNKDIQSTKINNMKLPF